MTSPQIRKRTILFVILGLIGLIIGTQSNVTSQCCLFSKKEPEPVAVFRPIVVQQPIVQRPMIVSRPVLPQAVVVNRPITTYSTPQTQINYRPVQANVQTVSETVMQNQEITTYETVWEEETRYRTRTITRQVPETSVRTETVKVLKPVWETIEKDSSYDVVRYVPETSEREEVQTVSRPITEMQTREIVQTVQRPVTETVIQQQQITVNRPVTTYQTQYKDVGQYVDEITPQNGKTYTKLTWQKGGNYFDPATGTTKFRLPGLYWTELQGPTQYKSQKVYQQNIVTQEVPTTTYVPETIVKDVPITNTRMVEEQVVRTEQVPVTTYVQEQVVKKIPVTTYKQVVERVVQKTPVRVCRMQTEEQVREIPITTYKPVTEVVQEPYTVRVAKIVPKVTVVQRPVTVCRQVPVDSCCSGSNTITPVSTSIETNSGDSTLLPGNSESSSQTFQSGRVITNLRPSESEPVYPGPATETVRKIITTEDNITEISSPGKAEIIDSTTQLETQENNASLKNGSSPDVSPLFNKNENQTTPPSANRAESSASSITQPNQPSNPQSIQQSESLTDIAKTRPELKEPDQTANNPRENAAQATSPQIDEQVPALPNKQNSDTNSNIHQQNIKANQPVLNQSTFRPNHFNHQGEGDAQTNPSQMTTTQQTTVQRPQTISSEATDANSGSEALNSVSDSEGSSVSTGTENNSTLNDLKDEVVFSLSEELVPSNSDKTLPPVPRRAPTQLLK